MSQLRKQLAGWNDDPSGFDWNFRSISEYLARFDDRVAINVAYLVPHGTLRMMAVGMDDRPATPRELDRMKQWIAEGMVEGAVGLSSGLTYVPGMFATDDELVELCKVLGPYGGYYCPHHRNYGFTRSRRTRAASRWHDARGFPCTSRTRTSASNATAGAPRSSCP